MKRFSKEKIDVMDEILKKHFKSQAFNEQKKCPDFNESAMAAYIEKDLPPQKDKKYEDHLIHCSYCRNILSNIKNEINILYKAKLTKISEELLSGALEFVEKENQINNFDFNISKIVVRIKEKGIELIEAVNFNHIKPVPLPSLRDKDTVLLKEIILEPDFNNKAYQITIQSYLPGLINININFPDSLYEEIKDKQIDIVSKKTKITKKIDKKTIIEGLTKDKYQLLIDNFLLIKIELN